MYSNIKVYQKYKNSGTDMLGTNILSQRAQFFRSEV